MKKLYLIPFVFLCAASLFAASLDTEGSDLSAENSIDAGAFAANVRVALSNADYMVTAGDVYSLNYAAGTAAVSYTIPVDPSYRIRVSNLAVLDAKGKSYIQLKKEVEEIVQKNYPMSGVQFVLLNPAQFKVTVTGEVNRTQERQAWALTRLSSVIVGTTTDYSSARDITITSTNGKKKVCDIFKAQRDGDLSQDPYLRPGDVITVSRINRVVTITGAVERPGKYELMKDENLQNLISYYGNGLTEMADTARIELVRSRNNMDVGGEKLYLSQKDIDANYEMLNGDIITINSKSDLLPYVVVEGIINTDDEETAEALAEDDMTPKDTMRHRTIKFYDGENYASLIRRYQSMFNSYSDLENSYIERGDKKIAMNLEEIIEDVLYVSPYNVERGDKIVVPFVQHFVNVLVAGEVGTVHEEAAWPLRRLSTIIGDNLTDYSSTRDVIVTSVEGKTSTYDLFKASREGDLSQNPYIRSGETITVQRMKRRVTISGAVERPGTYQLKDGENLKDLIEYYGNGTAPLADLSRIEVTRLSYNNGNNNNNKSGEKIYWNEEDVNSNAELLCYDSVYISTFRDLRPVMFMEGAIKASEDADVQSSDRQTVRFEQGTNYAYLVRSYSGWFASAAADTEHAYVIRGDKTIPVNLNQMLYDQSYYSELTVESSDILMVPFKQLFVSVAGAVYSPGRYPYIPDRTYDYYVGLAGGFIKDKNTLNAVDIIDIDGNKLSKSDVITPETTITAEYNSALYKFNQYSGIVTTVLSLLTTSLSAWAVIKAQTSN